MITKKTIKVFGVAGSGKTTKCLELIKTFLHDYKINEIGFTTYTKAGMYSIIEKLEKAQIFLPEDNNFGTLHSLCWKIAEFGNKIAQKSTIQEYFKKRGIDYNTMKEEGDEKTLGEYIIESYEHIQNRTGLSINSFDNDKLKELILEKYIEDDNVSATEAKDIAEELKKFYEWKKKKDIYVYSDGFIKILENKLNLPVKILIVDETQDLFKSQIDVVKMWIKDYDKEIFVIAGDDDQVVHQWAGSDPEFLIGYKDDKTEKIILERTYRCKEKISKLCNIILNQIKHREPKKMISYKSGGIVKFLEYPKIEELIKLVNTEETTFFLFRTKRLRKEVSELILQMTNMPFSYIGDKLSSKYSLKFCLINNAIKKLSKKERITFEEACKLIEVIKTENLHKGKKTNFKKEESISSLSYNEFTSNVLKWGLRKFSDNFEIEDELLKNIEYTNIPKKDAERAILKNEEIRERIQNFDGLVKYRIKTDNNRKYAILPLQLGTFHASKGLEANTVVVFLGTSDYFSKMDDSEMRCLYVACSRACNTLVTTYTNFGKEEGHLYEKFIEIWKIYQKSNGVRKSGHYKESA